MLGKGSCTFHRAQDFWGKKKEASKKEKESSLDLIDQIKNSAVPFIYLFNSTKVILKVQLCFLSGASFIYVRLFFKYSNMLINHYLKVMVVFFLQGQKLQLEEELKTAVQIKFIRAEVKKTQCSFSSLTKRSLNTRE